MYGYNVLQMMDVALYVAPKFHPDVYLVALTHIQAGGKKASTALHLARLKLEGIDLKYDFLRQIAAQAGIQPGDHMNALMRKLAPFHFQMTQWALEQIRDHAAAEGAQDGHRSGSRPLSPPTSRPRPSTIFAQPSTASVSRSSIFGTPSSPRTWPTSRSNTEWTFIPTQRGHEIIFESLYQAIQQDPKFSASLLGTSGDQQDSIR